MQQLGTADQGSASGTVIQCRTGDTGSHETAGLAGQQHHVAGGDEPVCFLFGKAHIHGHVGDVRNLVLAAAGQVRRQTADDSVEGLLSIDHHTASRQNPAVHAAVPGHFHKAVFVHRGHQHSDLVNVGVQQNMGVAVGVSERSHHTAHGIDFHIGQEGQQLPGGFGGTVLTACGAGGTAEPEKHFL